MKLRYLTGGESHGPCLTAIVEGLPYGLEVKADEVDLQLMRRQQGYGRGGRMVIEKDRVEFLSGLRFNHTIGSPVTMQIRNRDWEKWQEKMAPQGAAPPGLPALTRPRPGHADLAGGYKYGCHDLRAILERSSARETAIRVAVGSLGRILLEKYGFNFYSHVPKIGSVEVSLESKEVIASAEEIENSPLRCADSEKEKEMIALVDRARENGDTLGGVAEIIVTGLIPGLGSHVFPDRRLDGRIAGALMSIQAVKGVEIGIGFKVAEKPGSAVHDPIMLDSQGHICRPSNNAGGIEGGISNGMPLLIRIAMKPIPTLMEPLPSVDWHTGEAVKGATERSDTCAVPALAVVAEAVVAWELALAFREKFSGDSIEEIDSAFNNYMEKVNSPIKKV